MIIRSKHWIMGVSVPFLAVAQSRADEFGITHETYVEDHGRMTVQTETGRAHVTLAPWFDFTVRGVYDGITGATPIGAPAIKQLKLEDFRTHQPIPPAAITGFTRPLNGVTGASPGTQVSPQGVVPLANSHDIRRGIDINTGFTFGPNRFVPEISYSNEHDYISYSGAFNFIRELNDKNTTLNVGWSHSYDQVLSNQFTYITRNQVKKTDDFIFGVAQVVTPWTLFSADGTISHGDGYLDDPYRSVVFQETVLDPNARVILHGEKRPDTRDSQAMLLTLTQAVPKLNASVEGTYRFYHDSFGTIANTLGIEWLQKIGHYGVISPSFRYYRQGAAHFYGIQFPGDPVNDRAHVPSFYSSDYRLSFLETFTLGLDADVKLRDQWDLHLGYQRYWMRGLDGKTLQSTYPSAHIFTVGLTFSY
jgi:hypothetical protein